MNELYYGDNLEVMRKYIPSNSIDLCYIDPPFNSKRNYNQIYNRVGKEDKAQAQAFIDMWSWDTESEKGLEQIRSNYNGVFTKQSIDLINGLEVVLGKDDLFAYLISMTLRIAEIHRTLKDTGSFYLHCNPTASHYLKLVLDSIYIPQGGDFQNEVIWNYGLGGSSPKRWQRKHDVLFFYTKSNTWTFNPFMIPATSQMMKGQLKKEDDVWEIPTINNMAKERLGYPTQKPEELLKRIINASSNENDTVLDIFCGCGTTVNVAQELNRKWIGVDITYQSISLILKRLEETFGKKVLDNIKLDGIPKDVESAKLLALKKDDRVRKEFEKWAVLTYTNNRAVINDKKGADGGIDGTAYFQSNANTTSKVVLQAKSGNVKRSDISTLNSDRMREKAELAILLTLEEPTQPMINEANGIGIYHSEYVERNIIQIVKIKDIIENNARLDIPMSHEVLKQAKLKARGNQMSMLEETN